MGERTGYPPGTFCWVDLATTDPRAAKAFYSVLFGWEAQDMPIGNGGTYTMLRLQDRDVAALYEQPADQRGHVPPNWVSYVCVEDSAAVAAKAAELGGNVVEEPFQVVDAGRMAVVADPHGAVFAVWEPGRPSGRAWSTTRTRCRSTSSTPPTPTRHKASTPTSSDGGSSSPARRSRTTGASTTARR